MGCPSPAWIVTSEAWCRRDHRDRRRLEAPGGQTDKADREGLCTAPALYGREAAAVIWRAFLGRAVFAAAGASAVAVKASPDATMRGFLVVSPLSPSSTRRRMASERDGWSD